MLTMPWQRRPDVRQLWSILCGCALGWTLVGCSESLPEVAAEAGVDGGGGRDAGSLTDVQRVEAPAVQSCQGRENGAPCAEQEGLICIDQQCRTSRCNDGYLDPNSEDCEDGNEESGDGCTSCRFDCVEHGDCLDDNPCNGLEQCTAAHRCEPGDLPSGTTGCGLDGGEQGSCRGGICVLPGCGDGSVDPNTGEQCEDKNDVSGDGCEPDCTWTCEQDKECEDGDVCNGVATCNSDAHVCVAGTPLICDDEKACTEDFCDPETGCQVEEIDSDGDRHSCEEDCNDNDPAIYVGAPEYCDGKDNDCNDKVDDGKVVKAQCFRDADKDGYALDGAAVEEMCVCPEGYTLREPADAPSQDCYDRNLEVHPAQTGYFPTAYCLGWAIGGSRLICKEQSWDYNCDREDEPRYRALFKVCTGSAQRYGGCCCSGWEKEVPKCGNPGTFVSCNSGKLFGGCETSRQKDVVQACR